MSEPPNDEVLDGVPVFSGGAPSDVNVTSGETGRAVSAPLGAQAQAAVAAAGGFLAGAALLGLVHRRRMRRMALLQAARRPRVLGRSRKPTRKSVGELAEIVASRSLLVDVHLLGSSGRAR